MTALRLAASVGLLAAVAVGCGSSTTIVGANDGGAADSRAPIDGGAADSGVPADGSASCHSNADCTPSFECSPGGVTIGCGICAMPQNPCSVDSDCALIHDAAPTTQMVCGPAGGCVCPVGGKSGSCIPACQSASDCSPDESCSPTGHCVAKSCTTDAECPSTQSVDFACSAGTCAPKSCRSDADCGAHYCVSGTCYPQAGMCVPPAA